MNKYKRIVEVGNDIKEGDLIYSCGLEEWTPIYKSLVGTKIVEAMRPICREVSDD